jgi:HEAT repeat protein
MNVGGNLSPPISPSRHRLCRDACMNRPWLATVVVISLVVGCGKSPPAPQTVAPAAPGSAAHAPAAETATELHSPNTTEPHAVAPESVARATAPPTPALAAPGKTAPPAVLDGEVSDDLRKLAARLVERDPDGAWRVSEPVALELEKQTSDAATKLLPLFRDPSIDARRGAAFYLLGSFDPTRPKHVEAFTYLLQDPDKTIRGIGLSAVKQMREADIAKAAGELAKMLDPQVEEQTNNRASIVRLLGKLKSDGSAAIDPLVKSTASDPEPTVRAAALMAISQIAPPEKTVPAYRAALADGSPAVRLVAAVRLRQLGPAAADARPELGKALADGDARVAEAAAEALLNIGGPAVSTLVELLASPQPTTRKLALAALAKLGPAASAAEPAIKKCLQDSDGEVRQLAAIALQNVSGK